MLEAPPREEAEGTAEQEERGRPGNGCRLDLSLFAAGQPDARALSEFYVKGTITLELKMVFGSETDKILIGGIALMM